jgi:hypothetical protein
MPAPSKGDGPAACRVDVASMEVLPERGLADAVAAPPVAVGEAAAVVDADAGALADGDGAASAGARITAGAPPGGAGAAVDGPGTAGTAGAAGVVGCGVPGAGGATGCGAIVCEGDGFGVRLGSGSSGSSVG